MFQSLSSCLSLRASVTTPVNGCARSVDTACTHKHAHAHTFPLPQRGRHPIRLNKIQILLQSLKLIRLLAAQSLGAASLLFSVAPVFFPVMTDFFFPAPPVYFAALSVFGIPTGNIDHTTTCLVHS